MIETWLNMNEFFVSNSQGSHSQFSTGPLDVIYQAGFEQMIVNHSSVHLHKKFDIPGNH